MIYWFWLGAHLQNIFCLGWEEYLGGCETSLHCGPTLRLPGVICRLWWPSLEKKTFTRRRESCTWFWSTWVEANCSCTWRGKGSSSRTPLVFMLQRSLLHLSISIARSLNTVAHIWCFCFIKNLWSILFSGHYLPRLEAGEHTSWRHRPCEAHWFRPLQRIHWWTNGI